MSNGDMEALVFRYDVLRYLATRVVYATARRLWSARLAPLRRQRIPLPAPRENGWARLRVRLSGVCGSDLSFLTARDSLYLEPEATYPFVPGHEVVGRLETGFVGGPGEGDREGGREPPSAGDRVAVWPVVGCRARGGDACPACAAGWEGLCQRRRYGWPDEGLAIGFNRETGGGWSEACLAHSSQLWRLPDAVADEDALLLDPAAAALAALLRSGDQPPERTLVIGAGTIGLLVLRLHSALDLGGDCELLARYATQGADAERLGYCTGLARNEQQFCAWASERGIPSRRVRGYGHVFRGSFDRVIDAAGSRQSLRWALAAVRPGGRVVLLAAPAALDGVDPTPIWYREITCQGIFQYGPVPWEGRQRHPYAVLLPLLEQSRVRFRDLVTHTFPLARYVRALGVCVRRREKPAIKVAFRPGAEP